MGSETEDKMVALSLATTKACDANAALIMNGDLHSLHPIFRIYGHSDFSWPCCDTEDL
jgi:hypothetical protein